MLDALVAVTLAMTVTDSPPPSPKPAAKADSLLVLEAVEVTPPQPGPDTLCRLKVRLRNKGSQVVSDLTFDVELNGLSVPVYANQSWALNLGAGKETELQLYNFWTTETGRPVPKDGRLVVAVRVKSARWYEADAQGAPGPPAKEVDPLPPARSVTLNLTAKGGS